MEKKPPDFGMLDYKAKIGEGNMEKLMSELEYKLKEKKPPDLGILDYKAEIGEGDTEKLKYELESELEETKTPYFSMLGYNAKVLNKWRHDRRLLQDQGADMPREQVRNQARHQCQD